MVERKHFGGDREAAFDYLGIARNVLDQLKASMRLNGLQVLARQVTLPNGVLLHVSSVFGQDSIRIEAPPELAREVQDEVDALAEDALVMPIFGTLTDTVQVASQLKLTVRVRDVVGGGTGLVNGQDPLHEIVTMPDSLVVTIVRTTYPTTSTTLPPQIFIGGATSNGHNPFIWDDVNGYTSLDIGSVFGNRQNGIVLGISPNGQVLCGSVEIYDTNKNSAGNTVGWEVVAAKWASRNDTAQLAKYTTGSEYGAQAFTVTDDGNTVAGTTNFSRGFTWDGRNNHGVTLTASVPAEMFLTSPDGHVTVSGKNYKVDNGPWLPWVSNASNVARQAPSDAYALCVVHVPYIAPTPTPPTVTTTVLVFSG